MSPLMTHQTVPPVRRFHKYLFEPAAIAQEMTWNDLAAEERRMTMPRWDDVTPVAAGPGSHGELELACL